MTKFTLVFVFILGWAGSALAVGPDQKTTDEILTLERQTMEGWQRGNPDPVLALSAPEITYFHVITEQRVDGLDALRKLFEPYRGRPLFDGYEIADPKVQISGRVAVLTYRLVTRNGPTVRHWNGTQVYEQKKEGWRIIHSHWSQANVAPTNQ